MNPPTPLERSWLRHAVLILLVDLGGDATVDELVANLSVLGVATRRNSSRAVSDSLRWEVAKGRVKRVGRGRYVIRSSGLTKRHVRYARQRVREAVEADRANRQVA